MHDIDRAAYETVLHVGDAGRGVGEYEAGFGEYEADSREYDRGPARLRTAGSPVIR